MIWSAAAVDSPPPMLQERRVAVIGALSGISGVALIATSFAINNGIPDDATTAVLTAFARQHLLFVMWGAWMQAVGVSAILLGAVFMVVGVATIGRPVLPAPVLSMGAIQAIWWLLGAAELFRRAVRQSTMGSSP